MSIRPDILNELGLSPVWKLRASADAGAAAASASVADSTPSVPEKISSGLRNGGGGAEVAVAEMDWDSLREAVLRCEKCGLCRGRKQAVFGVGDRSADLFLAGEGPGREEDRLGEPFVGRAGKLLDLMLAAIGLARDEGVYIANVVKCRPPENRNPTAEESGACMPYLDRQIALAGPRLLVALGRGGRGPPAGKRPADCAAAPAASRPGRAAADCDLSSRLSAAESRRQAQGVGGPLLHPPRAAGRG